MTTIEYQVEILRGIDKHEWNVSQWESISIHRMFPAALDEYCELEEQGYEVRIIGVLHKEWTVL